MSFLFFTRRTSGWERTTKPSRLLNVPILIENPSSHENIPGVVSTWKNQRGVYKWKVLQYDGSIEYLECQALADAIRFANETGMPQGSTIHCVK
ncbi:hypothetical protein L914_20597 [Phytophthora nicotianae]|uniref:Uncharacterized protein n=1 Tax=Phytophthora nicotianae TaxID=4792 RepID=W2M8Q4_PHYNI|nr:hypothetical protein L914_20597 [Phytophthora nicotianae]